MEIILSVLLNLALIIFCAGIAGLIKPSLVRAKSRFNAFVTAMVISFGLIILAVKITPFSVTTMLDVLLLSLSFIFLACILGLIKPSLIKLNSRVHVLLIALGLLILIIVIAPEPRKFTEQTVEPVEQKKESQQPPKSNNKENKIPENIVKDDSY